MSWTRRRRVQAFLGLLLAIIALTPALLRGWPLIVEAWPIWAWMLAQALALLAAFVLLAGFAAAFVTWRRERLGTNA